MASAGLNDSNRDNASDFIDECSVTRSCEPCMKANTSKAATVFCKDCNEFICETCRNPHIAYKSGQHGMVRIQESDSSEEVVDMKGMDMCKEHGKRFEFVCEDHSTLCCTTCVFTHRKCDKLDEIDSISLQKRAEIDNLKQRLLKLESDADANVIECKQSEKELNESMRDISKEVDDLVDRFIKQIEEAKRQCLTRADALKCEEVERLNDMHAINTKVKAEIDELLSIFSSISKQGTYQQMYIFSKLVKEKCKKIGSDIKEQRITQVSTKMTFSYPRELSSLPEMGNNFIKVNLERTDAANLDYNRPHGEQVPATGLPPKPQFQDLEVERNSVELQQKLGSGGISQVWAGKWRKIVDVAVKTLAPGMMTPEAFLEEAKLMHRLHHTKIVRLLAVCTKSEPTWIITELMVNGSLFNYLKNDNGKTITLNIIVDMAGQIADGMAYLEANNCIHRDLCAANILVGQHNEVKIASFKLARVIRGNEYVADAQGTMFRNKWTAIDTSLSRKFSIKSDVWSYGVLLYELISFGKSPYPDMTNHEAHTFLKDGNNMARPTGGPIPCPDPYYEHMVKCWNRSPENRPTFDYLQDFFKNYPI